MAPRQRIADEPISFGHQLRRARTAPGERGAARMRAGSRHGAWPVRSRHRPRRTIHRCDQWLVEILDRQCFPADSQPVDSARSAVLSRACQSELFVHSTLSLRGRTRSRRGRSCRRRRLNASPSPVVTTHPHSASSAPASAARYSASSAAGQAVALLRPVEPADQHRAVSLDHDFAHRRTSAAQPSSGSLPALTVDCSSTYSESPSDPNSRPMPDCLNPPNGQLVSSVYMLMP